VTTNQVAIHIVIIVGVAMALVVIIVAIVVIVVMASPSPASNPTRPPTLRSPSATETIHHYTSSAPSGMALIKSLFNEGAVFLAALNMGTGDSGRDEKSHEEDYRRV
jgi:hypothetical protein